MAKPKNRVICPDCGKPKMLFETEKKAELFIKFNGEEICNDVSKLRTYYCPACCGYHISSKPQKKKYSNTENLIQAYHKEISTKIPIYDEPTDEKIRKYIEEISVKYFSCWHMMDLAKYMKMYYSDKLSGKERDYIFRKIIEKRKFERIK